MKLNRNNLRRMILNEIKKLNEENPGSRFKVSAQRGERDTHAAELKEMRDKATEELKKTYDWFDSVVFPQIEAGIYPIVADDNYHTIYRSAKRDHSNLARIPGVILKDTKFDNLNHQPQNLQQKRAKGYTLGKFYEQLENAVVANDLSVPMQSEVPDELE